MRALGLLGLVGLALAVATGTAAAEFSANAGSAGDRSWQPWVELISWKPRAYLYHNFLTPEECDPIIKVRQGPPAEQPQH